MTGEIGLFALILAFAVALFQGTVPLVGAARNDPALMAVSDVSSVVLCALVTIAIVMLGLGYVTSDFSLLNVWQNSHTLKPLIYKVSGVWGNHEGSLVLWVLILAVYGAALAVFGRQVPPDLRARALAIQGLIAAGFLAFSLFTSNPFARIVPIPAEGMGLNPILQDPGLAFHPPCLYMGYVGLSVAFSFGIAGLLGKQVDSTWAKLARPWVLLAWCFLTAGIALGSWWAYYELGWGGWWFWDPVENASFIPWLIATALLHSLRVAEKRDTLKAWTLLLCITGFSLSLLGTFLVRSGAITSVHTFASDPTRGIFILAFLAAVTGGAFALFAVRAPRIRAEGLFEPVSREGALLLNNVFFGAAAATVLLGTLYPIFMELAGSPPVSVGPPYYNSVFLPLAMPALVLAALGPAIPWRRTDLPGVLHRMRFAAVCALGAVVLTAFLHQDPGPLALAGFGLAAFLAAGTLRNWLARIRPTGDLVRVFRRARGLPASAHGMTLAHLGVAVLVVGVTASSTGRVDLEQVMHPGETLSLAGRTIEFMGVENIEGPNYTALQGRFQVTGPGAGTTMLWPERRAYLASGTATTEAAILETFAGDIYVVLGDPVADGGWGTRLTFNPLIWWIWGGAFLGVLGGLVSITERARPRRARLRSPSVQPA
ncbi:MAG: heme lyase CcmF/NrfE family subunit [Rhodospirillales bacterium]|nr:heme lyase CcmF/NrfE family subunit [Rhodospirillales bacterium]